MDAPQHLSFGAVRLGGLERGTSWDGRQIDTKEEVIQDHTPAGVPIQEPFSHVLVTIAQEFIGNSYS